MTFEFRGLSTDEKPIAKYGGIEIENGSVFIEMDSETLYFYDKGTDSWVGGEK